MGDQRDLGPRALKEIAELWMADGARLRWSENGFDWWPGDFKVSVNALRRLDEYGPEMWQLSVKTDFLRDVPINDPTFVGSAALVSSIAASTYGWVYPTSEILTQYAPGSTPRLYLSNTAYVTSENIEWMPWLLGSMAILQPVNAQIQSRITSNLLGGVPDVSRPPELAGLELDGMLEIVAQLYAPLGQEASRWIGGEEFSAIAANCGTSDCCFGIADHQGLAIEASFGDTTAMVALRTDQTHPQLGNGLLVTLKVPHFDDPQMIANECAGLNFMESLWNDFPQFGCWHSIAYGEDRHGAAFSTFVPNALYQPGLANEMALWMVQRAQRLRQARWPDVPDKPMHEILEARLAGRED
jgi:hypothetical protein